MTAMLVANYYGGQATEPGGVSATTGIRFNREDTQTGNVGAIPIPQSGPNTYFSFYKQIALAVTTTDPVSHISNRTIKMATNVSLPTGVRLYYMGTGQYRQATVGSRPPDQNANSALPVDPSHDGTYTAITLVAQAYDAASVASSSSGRNGTFCRLVFAVDATYTGGAGMLTLPNLIVGYDEA